MCHRQTTDNEQNSAAKVRHYWSKKKEKRFTQCTNAQILQYERQRHTEAELS